MQVDNIKLEELDLDFKGNKAHYAGYYLEADDRQVNISGDIEDLNTCTLAIEKVGNEVYLTVTEADVCCTFYAAIMNTHVLSALIRVLEKCTGTTYSEAEVLLFYEYVEEIDYINADDDTIINVVDELDADDCYEDDFSLLATEIDITSPNAVYLTVRHPNAPSINSAVFSRHDDLCFDSIMVPSPAGHCVTAPSTLTAPAKWNNKEEILILYAGSLDNLVVVIRPHSDVPLETYKNVLKRYGATRKTYDPVINRACKVALTGHTKIVDLNKPAVSFEAKE